MAIGSITPFRPTGTVSLGAGTLSAVVAWQEVETRLW